MEKIQRALEISRLQRPAVAEVAPAGTAPQSDSSVRPELVANQTRAEHRDAQRFPVDRAKLRARRVVLSDESSAAARAYRMLRAQLLQRARSSRTRVLGIVSAATGEGKTLTAVNLAISLAAEPNQSVALIDLDLRHPCIARTLDITPDTGLETWLSARSPGAPPVCELDGIPRLQVLPTLAPVAGSSEALAGARTRMLLDQLRAQDEAQFLILDLPPALLSDDVLTIAPLVDGFLLVITEGRTRRDDVERVFELLGRNRVVGTVLNGSSASEQRAY
jgi:Mrp family chromosome partitioning ATPase